MSRFPSLPLFTDAYMADTRHLSAQEHGAYLLLIMMAWRSPGCVIPDDDLTLHRWASVDLRTWRRIKPVVMSFWTLSDGFWTQARLRREHEFVSKRAEVSRANGEHGGRPKALKKQGPDNPAGSSQGTRTESTYPYPYKEREDPAPPPDGGEAQPAISKPVPSASDPTGAPLTTRRAGAVDQIGDAVQRAQADAVLADPQASDEDRFYALKWRLADKGIVFGRAVQLAKLQSDLGFGPVVAALQKTLKARDASSYLGKIVSEAKLARGAPAPARPRKAKGPPDPDWVDEMRDEGHVVRADGPNRWLCQGRIFDDQMNEVGF